MPQSVLAVAAAIAMAVALLAGCSSSAQGAAPQGGEEVVPGTAPASTTSTGPPVVAERVLLLGDSSMVDAALALGPTFTAAGAEVVVSDAAVGFGLTGVSLARLPSPWREVWPGLVEEVQPDLTVVMMGSWDVPWVEEHGVDEYRELVAEAVDVLTVGGGRVLWLSMLPGEDHGVPVHFPPTAAYAGVPALRPGQVAFVDVAPALVGPSGGFPPTPVVDGELVRLRKLDGWHLCQDGAIRIAELVSHAAAELGLAAPAPDGWQLGAWWDDEAFTGSPACWPPGAWRDGGPDRTPPPGSTRTTASPS